VAGRPERPLDPNDGPVERLACELRRLRQEAGSPTYRAMARRAGCGASTLSQAASGERLPTLPVLLAYVRACGGEPQPWERRWRQAAREAAGRPAQAGTDRPYLGLERFGPDDRHLFFGRDAAVAGLLARVHAHRLVALVGASGSGKSSLLRAGLVPALRGDASPGRRPATVRILTPGPHPAAHLDALTPRQAAGDTVVLVDQFEEVFTLCTDAAERAAFLDALPAATAPGGRLRVVLAVRADFFGRCAEHQGLAAALPAATVLLPPMGEAELREAVVRPAAATGLIVERSLTARIVREVAGEPGGLPLMSHALLETWRRRRGRALTEEMYEAAGGIRGAVAATAESVYAGFSPAEQEAARRILLRLVTPGEGAQDTRRPTDRAELETGSAVTGRVLERLVRARLLTLDGDVADLAHEVLLTAWPRYRAWIEEDRERLRLHRRLTEAARTWQSLDGDPGALYRGTRLAAAEDAFARDGGGLCGLERSFLRASLAARDEEARAAARTSRRLRALTATLSVLLVLAVTAGLLAWGQSRAGARQRRAAVAAGQVALSRQLAAQSTVLMAADPDLASLLAVQAYRTSPTREATAALYPAAARPLLRRFGGHGGAVAAVVLSRDGGTLATAGDDGTLLWGTATGARFRSLPGQFGTVTSLAFSPDGAVLATGSRNGIVQLWSLATGTDFATLDADGSWTTALVFGPDGTLATGGSDGTVRLWDAAGHRTVRRFTAGGGPVGALAFGPDGRTLAAGGRDGTVRLWRTASRAPGPPLAGRAGPVVALAFGRGGRTLVAGGRGGTLRVWDAATRTTRAAFPARAGRAGPLALSPDGRTLATGGGDGTVRLWDTTTGTVRASFAGHSGPVDALAFGADGETLATGGHDATAGLWSTAPHTTVTTADGDVGPVDTAAFSPDGKLYATGGQDGTVRLWDTATGSRRAVLARGGSPVKRMAFSPNGGLLAAGSADGTVQLWDTTTGRRRRRFDAVGPIAALTFSPCGRTLATTASFGKVQLWNVATGGKPRGVGGTGAVFSAAFSPDGRWIAVGTDNGSAQVWDVETGRLVKTPHAGTGLVVSVAFSPDGRTLAAGDDQGVVRLWRLAAGGTRATLPGNPRGLLSIAYGHDGRTLAVAGQDGTIDLWDVATRRIRTTLTGRIGPLASVAFARRGHRLAAVGRHGTVRTWDVDLPGADASVRRICAALHRDFTPEERAGYLGGLAFPPVCGPRSPG
jgi:WD40 repeat protein